MRAKTIIGWREWVGLPELGAPGVRAKIDTGAKTSSIHAYGIKQLTRDGQPWVSFKLHPLQRRREPEVACTVPILEQREVTSSNGVTQLRFVIKTPLVMGPYTFDIELTLTRRDAMGYRMLIGREALTGLFIVDSAGSYAFGEHREAEFYPNLKR